MVAEKLDKPKPAVEQIPPAEVVKGPEVKEPVEPPQIKVPIEVPDIKKNEEVQLDRPGAGNSTKTKGASFFFFNILSTFFFFIIIVKIK